MFWWNRWSFHFYENEINNSEASCFKKSPVYISVSARDVEEMSCWRWFGFSSRAATLHSLHGLCFLRWGTPGICSWFNRRRTSLLQRKGLHVSTARCAELLGNLWITDPGAKQTFVFTENLLSDLCLETTFSCLCQWFWSISETTTAMKYKPGIFAPTDIA